MKANKNLLVLALVLALATSMVVPLMAQTSHDYVKVEVEGKILTYFMTSDVKLLEKKLAEFGCRMPSALDLWENPWLAQSVRNTMQELESTWSLCYNASLLNWYVPGEEPKIVYLSTLQDKTMKLVQGGTFTIGNTDLSKNTNNPDQFPAHQVTVSSFYVSENPITLEQWMDRLNKYPYGYLETYNKITVQGDSFIYPDNYGKPDNSKFVPRAHWKFTAAANITWFDALTYCNRRSIAEGLTPCYASNGSTDAVTNPKYLRDKNDLPNITCDWNANGYRLPTEAEWEFAARKGVLKNDYPYNGGEWASDKYEWVWDWYSTTYYQMSGNSTNPRGPVYGEIQYSSGGRTDRREVPCRVIRGPISNPSSRGKLDPGDYEIMVGPHPIAFRVVRNIR